MFKMAKPRSKVAKLHKFNMRIYNGGQYFKAISAKAALLVFINLTMSFVLLSNSLITEYKTNIYSLYFSFYIMIMVMAMYDVFQSTYLLYEDENKEVKREVGSYVTLYNILPVGRRKFFLGRLKYSFDVYMGVWVSSISLIIIYHLINYTFYEGPFFNSVVLVEFLKPYLFANLMLLLGTLGLTAVYYKSKIKLILPMLIGLATYLTLEWNLVSPNNLTWSWWLYPLLTALIVTGIIVLRCSKINESDIIEGKGKPFKAALRLNILNKISSSSMLFINRQFILLIPILTLVFLLITNKGFLFSITIPYLIVLTLMASKSSVTIVNTQLSLMKSLPTNKKRVVKGIMVSIIASELASIFILLLMGLLDIRLGNNVDLGLLTIILLGIKLPLITTAMMIMLPRTLLSIYANKKPWNSELAISYILVIVGGAIALLGYYYKIHGGIWAVISVLLYALAIHVIRATYNYMVSRLEGPLNI